MIPSDAQFASVDLLAVKMTQLEVEGSLTELHEMWDPLQSGVPLKFFGFHECVALAVLPEVLAVPADAVQ